MTQTVFDRNPTLSKPVGRSAWAESFAPKLEELRDRLRTRRPQRVAERAGVNWQPESRTLILRHLDRAYWLGWPELAAYRRHITRRLQKLYGKSLTIVTLSILAIMVAISIGGVSGSATELTVQAFQSPIQTPTPFPYPPPRPEPSSTRPAACPPQTRWGKIDVNVEVEGLSGAERAMVRLQPLNENISLCLAARGITLPEMAFGNGSHHIQMQEIPDGAYYRLEIHAPPRHFLDPGGYLFQVKNGQIVRRPDFVFRFLLVPPSQQTLPPCRVFEKTFRFPSATPEAITEAIPVGTQRDICLAERTVDISTPPKQPERPQEASASGVGYHYAGPVTFQDNRGVWGSNTVVDPNVPHIVQPPDERFVVERVYANDASWDHWMEAGWAEVSWRDDRRYIYQYDSANATWVFFDEYVLPLGAMVETDVQYDPNSEMWKARYHLGGGNWAVLATADLGFITADRGYNRGEVYTADGIHPILPLSSFDKGYLLIDGIWRPWTTSYNTDVTEDEPYQVDMLSQYNRFNIHSPIVFIPLVLNNAQ